MLWEFKGSIDAGFLEEGAFGLSLEGWLGSRRYDKLSSKVTKIKKMGMKLESGAKSMLVRPLNDKLESVNFSKLSSGDS